MHKINKAIGFAFIIIFRSYIGDARHDLYRSWEHDTFLWLVSWPLRRNYFSFFRLFEIRSELSNTDDVRHDLITYRTWFIFLECTCCPKYGNDKKQRRRNILIRLPIKCIHVFHDNSFFCQLSVFKQNKINVSCLPRASHWNG